MCKWINKTGDQNSVICKVALTCEVGIINPRHRSHLHAFGVLFVLDCINATTYHTRNIILKCKQKGYFKLPNLYMLLGRDA